LLIVSLITATSNVYAGAMPKGQRSVPNTGNADTSKQKNNGTPSQQVKSSCKDEQIPHPKCVPKKGLFTKCGDKAPVWTGDCA